MYLSFIDALCLLSKVRIKNDSVVFVIHFLKLRIGMYRYFAVPSWVQYTLHFGIHNSLGITTAVHIFGPKQCLRLFVRIAPTGHGLDSASSAPGSGSRSWRGCPRRPILGLDRGSRKIWQIQWLDVDLGQEEQRRRALSKFHARTLQFSALALKKLASYLSHISREDLFQRLKGQLQWPGSS